MRLLGLIPARGGSKGVPRKNVREIAGKPLITWTVEAARACQRLSSVIVSTDDEEIAAAARDAGAQVPFLRPSELASDTATSLAVVEHALAAQREPIDAVVLLQPTSPLRTSADIDMVLDIAERTAAPSVVSVYAANQHPLAMYAMDGDGRLRPYAAGEKPGRRQDMPPIFLANGAIYFARCEWLLAGRTFIGSETIGYLMPAERSVDIDTPLDWRLAELLLLEQAGRSPT